MRYSLIIRLSHFAVESKQDLASQFEELARKVNSHDQAIAGLIHTISDLMSPKNVPANRPIGFVPLKDKSK